ncbi:hypothetical protein DFP73DRAFT_608369 [Morchella snyderi]|nr:hypothetical protein DFP73DRAFT_608369 [Morchella snyderi]
MCNDWPPWPYQSPSSGTGLAVSRPPAPPPPGLDPAQLATTTTTTTTNTSTTKLSPTHIMRSSNPHIPLELIIMIASYADTRTLSILTRSCRALHTLFNPRLQTAFSANLENIATWAITAQRPTTLSRAITAALGPTSPISTRKRPIRDAVGRRLRHLFYSPFGHDPVNHEKVHTLKAALSHSISPVTPAPRWSLDKTTAIPWLCYGVQHGDLALVQWLLEEAGARAFASSVRVEGNKTLLDLARYRRFDVPRSAHVEEIVQLLVDHDPQPLLTQFPGVRRENQRRLEEMLKVAGDPGALLNEWVEEELNYAYDRLLRKNSVVWPLAQRKWPVRYRLLTDAHM